MSVIPVYRELLRALAAEVPVRTALCPLSRSYLNGLEDTYGPEFFGPAGVIGALELMHHPLAVALAAARGYGMEEQARRLLSSAAALLPGTEPDLFLGTLVFIAPAATLSVQGRPAIALGLERFHPAPPPGHPRFLYHPGEAEEMIPHEAAHAARMQALGLPPTPRRLSLLDMILLEGTALVFTDALLGRKTLATFMPPDRLAWHHAADADVRAYVARNYHTGGLEAFRRHFSADSPISGYYAGYSLCRDYLDRYGSETVGDLVTLPSREILTRLGLGQQGLPSTSRSD